MSGWTSSTSNGCALRTSTVSQAKWLAGVGWFDAPGLVPSSDYVPRTTQKIVSPTFFVGSGSTDVLTLTFSLEAESGYDYICVSQFNISNNAPLPMTLRSSAEYWQFSTVIDPVFKCDFNSSSVEHCVSTSNVGLQSTVKFNLTPSAQSQIRVSFTSDFNIQYEGFLLTRATVCHV
jgi:hypothetical protein